MLAPRILLGAYGISAVFFSALRTPDYHHYPLESPDPNRRCSAYVLTVKAQRWKLKIRLVVHFSRWGRKPTVGSSCGRSTPSLRMLERELKASIKVAADLIPIYMSGIVGHKIRPHEQCSCTLDAIKAQKY